MSSLPLANICSCDRSANKGQPDFSRAGQDISLRKRRRRARGLRMLEEEERARYPRDKLRMERTHRTIAIIMAFGQPFELLAQRYHQVLGVVPWQRCMARRPTANGGIQLILDLRPDSAGTTAKITPDPMEEEDEDEDEVGMISFTSRITG
eukprot:CAMPEP_0206527478 /NCGR_PEP_ID=MMETSP0325_2-20121206/1368_1 /ASSEMBLY_ACC=CAM_ASM_000347 /TAXON_ID=2866 /ORGANISM="Crypthecodinium cohnii, Strain Seligo" /LENGTH=150 /DNA_ID=CAMNT_0054022887 /DNA_START=271 /DNA_END=720 /DNA_ORIENTATION=+